MTSLPRKVPSSSCRHYTTRPAAAKALTSDGFRDTLFSMEREEAKGDYAGRDLSDEQRIALASEAFREFYAQCFWYLREDLEITPANIEEIARGLRKHGGRRGFRLAAKLCP